MILDENDQEQRWKESEEGDERDSVVDDTIRAASTVRRRYRQGIGRLGRDDEVKRHSLTAKIVAITAAAMIPGKHMGTTIDQRLGPGPAPNSRSHRSIG